VIPDKPAEPTATITSDGADSGELFVAGEGDIFTDASVISVPEVVKKPEIFFSAEKMPQYVGGTEEMMKYLQKKLKYPAFARRTGVQGTVYVSFVINAEGNVVMVEILKGISKECDQEAKRVISQMPVWIAGMQNQMPMSVRMTLPIRFKLAE
jgi:protein TonB